MAVVAAAVILDPAYRIRGLRDSKLLLAGRREILAERIREHSLAWGLLSLAGSELAYFDASQLIAKYYSLGVSTDENNKVDKLEYEEAFTNMLASAERNARANAHAARIAAGAIPVQAKLAYQLASVERAGDLTDKIDALSEFWASSAFSQTAVMLARN